MERYTVVGLLGAGGMGRVYAALDPKTGERVAIKRALLPTPDQRERVERETRLQRQIAHPNVLPLLEVLSLPEGPALVMPWVEGPSLAALSAAGEVGVPQKLALFRQVVAGVAALHQAGLVHRDLKPGNVLLDASGEGVVAKVADFGLAKSLEAELSSLTQTGAVLGTPAYLAPEQRRDASRVDARADVYALGVMLTELLTGAHPGEGAWGELALQMRSIEPEDRPADASAVLARLPETPELSPSLVELCRALAPAPVDDTPLPEVPKRLPPEHDTFVGRHQELGELARALAAGQLVSIVGTAGIGKTRLALRHAHLWLEEYPGGVWFCELAEARDVDSIATAVARALDIPPGKGDLVTQLGHALASRGRCLLVLDNFEQVVQHAQSTLGLWARQALLVRFLVTTRQPLGLEGEEVFEVPALTQADAEALFRRRATASRPGFLPSPTEQAAIAALVQLIDHLPLAIELAAARVKVMAPSAILGRLSERFRLLAGPGIRNDRHATLLAALEWSFQLLSPDEQRALAQLSVFQGGWTAQAAQEVLALGETPPSAAVVSLVHQSLVRKASSGRFNLLVSIQHYALGKLEPQERARAEERHGDFFAHLGTDEALQALSARGGGLRWWAVEAELANLVTACERAVEKGEIERAAPCARAAWQVLGRQGPFRKGVALLERVLSLPLRPCALLAHLYRDAGDARQAAGDVESASAHYARALSCAHALGDALLEGLALGQRGSLHFDQGKMDEARADLGSSIASLRAVGAPLFAGEALGNLGLVCNAFGQVVEALDHCTAALAIARESGNRRLEGVLLARLGIFDMEQNRPASAHAHYDAALLIHREVGNWKFETFLLGNRALLYQRQGALAESRIHYDAALDSARQTGDRMFEATLLMNLGSMLLDAGEMDESRIRLEGGLAIAREIGMKRIEAQALLNLGKVYTKQGRVEESRARLEAGVAVAREIPARMAECDGLISLGILNHQQGRLDEAAAHYAAALGIVRTIGRNREEVVLLNCLGCLCREQQRLEEAQGHFETALALARAGNDRMMEGTLLANLGGLYQQKAQPEEANALYALALATLREVGARRLEGVVLGKLCELLLAEGRLDEAAAHLRSAMPVLREVDDCIAIAELLCVKARLDHLFGRPGEALAALDEATALADQMQAGPASELGQALSAARALLSTPTLA